MKLVVEGLSFAYGKRAVLTDVSFHALSGGIVSILGSNGAGKTTLLKCISGILKPAAGSVILDGANLLEMSTRRRAWLLSYVAQAASVSRTTVFDSVLLGRRPYLRASVSDEDMAITAQVIDEMNLTELAVRYIDELSGGELQKVQIARALAQQTSVLILDEPSNNLDLANQHSIMKIVKETASAREVCVIMTIHDVNLALQYSDRFLFVEHGQAVSIDKPEDLNSEMIKRIYGFDAEVVTCKGRRVVLPV